MQYRHIGSRLFVKLERGEEVLETLTSLCREHHIRSASFCGIGAVRGTELGYYDLETFSYSTRVFPEIFELVSLLGNVALVDGEPFVHAHASLADRELIQVGGHLVRATVAVTVEIFIDCCESTVERVLDPEVKLKLLKLDTSDS